MRSPLTVKNTETKMLPLPSHSPIFPHACKNLWLYFSFLFPLFFFSSSQMSLIITLLCLQERSTASVKLAAAQYFQAGGWGAHPWLCLSSWELRVSRAAVYGNTDLCLRQGKHRASVGTNIYRPLRSSPGKRGGERECERNLGWTDGNFISGFCYLSNIK